MYWESDYKILCSWVDVLIFYVLLFGVLYLAWCDFVTDPTKEQHKILHKSRKKCNGGPALISCTWEVQTHWDWKRRDSWREKWRACPSFFFTSRSLFTKNSPWQPKQSIPHTTVTFYSDRENVRRLHPELWLLHHDNTLSHTTFFTQEFFTSNNTTVLLHPPHFSLFPWLKIKLKGRHFDTLEVMEAGSQQCWTPLQISRMHFRKW
jgi:hypothetical protein